MKTSTCWPENAWPASDGSAYQEYALTDRGRGLFLVIAALGQWSCSGHEFRLVDRETGQPVRLELRAEDGRALGMDDVLLAGAPKADTGPARERGPKPPEPGGNLRQTNQCPRRMSDGG